MYLYWKAHRCLETAFFYSLIGGGIGMLIAWAMWVMDADYTPVASLDHCLIFTALCGLVGAVLFAIIPLLLSGWYGILYLCRKQN